MPDGGGNVPIPGSTPGAVYRSKGLTQRMVQNALDGMRDNLRAATPTQYSAQSWHDAANRSPEIDAVHGRQQTGLEGVDSAALRFGEGIAENKPAEAAQALLHMLSNPISASTELYQSQQVMEMQRKFAAQNASLLADMNKAMGSVAFSLRNLNGVVGDLGQMPMNANRASQILADKALCGNGLMSRLQDAIDSTDDPNQQTLIQGMMDDVRSWQSECQDRLAQDRHETANLTARVLRLSQLISTQAHRFADAADMALDAAGGRSANPLMDYIQNARPENATFALQLRNFLLGSWADFQRAVLDDGTG